MTSRTRSASRVDSTETSTPNNSDIKSALKEIVSRLDSIEKRIGSVDNRLDSIDGKIKSLEKDLQYQSDSVEILQKEVHALKDDMALVQQLKTSAKESEILSASKCLEIQGTPYHSNEKLLDIVAAVGNLVKTPINPTQIDYAYRNKRKNIVVKFLQSHVRNSVLESAKKVSKSSALTAKDIGYSSSHNKLYVNEFLLFDTRELFHKTRLFQKQFNYKYSWCINQKVYIREQEGKQAIRIHSVSDLKDLNPDYKG